MPVKRKTPQSAVKFSHDLYVRTHGRQPRGTGVWWFVDAEVEVKFHSGMPPALHFRVNDSLTKAKAQARRWAARLGIKNVTVCP